MLLDEQVRNMSWDEVERSDTLSRYLSDVIPRYPWIGGISMLDATGHLRLTTFQGVDQTETSADGDYLRGMLAQHGGSAVIDQQGAARTGGRLSVASRRTAPGGGFGGVILVSARPSFFTDFWQRATPQDVTVLFRADGTLLARNPPGTQDPSRTSVGKRLLTAIRSGEEGSLVSFSGMDGTERLIAYRKVAGFPRLHRPCGVDVERPAALARQCVARCHVLHVGWRQPRPVGACRHPPLPPAKPRLSGCCCSGPMS